MLRRLSPIVIMLHMIGLLNGADITMEGEAPPAARADVFAQNSPAASAPSATPEIKRRKTRTIARRQDQTGDGAMNFIVRVNVIKNYPRISQQPGAQTPAIINGAVMDNFAPNIQEVIATTGLVLDDKGHILVYLGERWMELHFPNIDYEVITLNGQVAHGKLRGIDERKGFVILDAANLKSKPAPIEPATGFSAGTPIKKIELIRPYLLRAVSGRIEEWDPQSHGVIELDRAGGHPIGSALTGGPVLSNEGKVIGLVIDKARPIKSTQRTQVGVLPMAEIWPAVQQIINTGQSIAGGWVGVFINDLTPDLREKINARVDKGILVTEVAKGSPAEKAGVQRGDIIQTIDQKVVAGSREFMHRVQNMQPGQRATLRVARANGIRDIPINIGSRRAENYVFLMPPPALQINTPEVLAKWQALHKKYLHDLAEINRQAKSAQIRAESMRRLTRELEDRQQELIESHVRLIRSPSKLPTMGISCNELPPQLGAYFGITSGKGILVSTVLPATPAEVAGIKAGDVILKMDNSDVCRCIDLVREVQKRKIGDKVKVNLWRQNKPLELHVTLDKWGSATDPSK